MIDSILSFLIFFVVEIWLLGSVFISAYWFFHPNEYFWEKYNKITIAIAVGSLIACFIIVTSGISSLLTFIPEDWTYKTEDGNIEFVRPSLSFLIGLASSLFLWFLFLKVQELREQNEDLLFEFDVRKEVKRLKELHQTFEKEELKLQHDGYITQLEEIEKTESQRKLTYREKRKRCVILELLADWETQEKN